MSWKSERYYRGSGHGPGLPPPMPGELSPKQKKQLVMAGAAIVLLGSGVLIGFLLAPTSPRAMQQHVLALEKALDLKDQRIADLEAKSLNPSVVAGGGHLSRADRARQEKEGHRYANALKRAGAQAAANLMEWYVARWNQLLDAPLPDDRTGRRAATLALLIGGMAANINEGDYVPWQAEFFDGHWLAEVHYDQDGDGYPGKRSMANPHDAFANISICHVVMALNLSVSDARVLVMPDMHCERADNKMSIFLQGPTFDDALTDFVKSARSAGFLVKESVDKNGLRLILVGSRPPPPSDE